MKNGKRKTSKTIKRSAKRNSSSSGRTAAVTKRKYMPRVRRTKAKRFNLRHDKVYAKGGDCIVVEQNVETTAANTNSFGFASFANDQIIEIMWKALIHEMMIRNNFEITTWNTTLSDVGTTLRVNYTSQIGGGLAFEEYLSGAGDTYQTMVDWCIASARPWYGDPLLEIFEVLLRPPASTNAVRNNIAYTEFRTANVKMKISCRAALKFQNRTINSAGNDTSDEVDNCPLIGRYYDVKGTVFRKHIPSPPTFGAGSADGYIAVAAEAFNGEPPLPSYFSNVTKSGGIKLKPGETKKSYLTYSDYGDWSKLHTKYMMYGIGQLANTTFGSARLFCFEKEISSSALEIRITQELNISTTGSATYNPQFPMLQTVKRL